MTVEQQKQQDDFDFDSLKEEPVTYAPTKDRLIVKPSIKKSNIILKGKPMFDNPIVEVLAKGEGTRTITGELVPIPCEVGDRLLIAYVQGMAMMPLKIDGEMAFLMGWNDVLAVCEPKPEAESKHIEAEA